MTHGPLAGVHPVSVAAYQQQWVVYFSSASETRIAHQIYRIRLDGTGIMVVLQGGGTNRGSSNPDFRVYAGVWSNVTMRGNGRLGIVRRLKVLVPSTASCCRPGKFRTTAESGGYQVKTRDGFATDEYQIKPPDFIYRVATLSTSSPTRCTVRRRFADQWGGPT